MKRNKQCPCAEDLVKAKRSKRVNWICYRLPNGRQRRESVDAFEDHNGYSIEDARTAEAKRKTQNTENRLMDVKPEFQTTFRQLSKWYLDLEKVKELASSKTVKGKIEKFNRKFGNDLVGSIKLADLENYQSKLKKEGLKPKTVDDDIRYPKAMINKAFDNDLVGGDVLKAFQRVETTLKKNSNARDRVLTKEEYDGLLRHSPKHIQNILIMGYWTGMRKGEILKLTWDKVDMAAKVIRLEASDTKERKAKTVPIGEEVSKLLSRIPRALHTPYVFLYFGKPIILFSTAIKTACEKAGIQWGREVKGGFIFHDLRHTFVTDMRRAGVSKSVRMSITGHTPKDMDDRYNKVDDQDKLLALGRLEAHRNSNVDQTVDQAPLAKKETL